MVQGQAYLRGGVAGTFGRFIIFTFKNYFTLCKTVLKKNYFFMPP